MKISLYYALLLWFVSLQLLRGQSISEKLAGDWTGKGTLMGQTASFTMQWSWQLEHQFLRLKFQNMRIPKDRTPQTLTAHAYYSITNDSTVIGTWFDSRGITLPLSGTIKDDVLTIFWGDSETEQGKTIYTYDTARNKMGVTDYILSAEKYHKFGTAVYEKIAD